MIGFKGKVTRTVCTIILSAAVLTNATSAGGLDTAYATEIPEESTEVSSEVENESTEPSVEDGNSESESGEETTDPEVMASESGDENSNGEMAESESGEDSLESSEVVPDSEEKIPESVEATSAPEEKNPISEKESMNPQESISVPGTETTDPGEQIPNSVDTENQPPIVTDPVEFQVPIYNYDIVNVVVPTSYAVALNPYEMVIKVNESTTSTQQVVSRNYGIINKSTRDKIVTVTLQLEDGNNGRITFVDSAEAALQADKDTYAIYLTLIPAADGNIRVNGSEIGIDTAAEAMKDVEMARAEENAVVLHQGNNQVSFRLAGASYTYKGGQELSLEAGAAGGAGELLELKELAQNGSGITAFTFGGVMNPNADWSKLINGLNISVIYTYENTDGSELIVPGTGAMVERSY